MSDSPLFRNAGPVALAAGGALAVIDVARYALMRDDRIGMLTDPLFRVVNGAYFFAFVGLAIGLVAVYGHQADRLGLLGLLGFLAALVGTLTQGGNMWFDGFAAPWLAEVAPETITLVKTPILVTGALLSYTFFALGWVLFGIACLKARTVPRAISLALVVAGVIGFQSGIPPYGAPIGLAVAALGGWLIHTDRVARRLTEPARV